MTQYTTYTEFVALIKDGREEEARRRYTRLQASDIALRSQVETLEMCVRHLEDAIGADERAHRANGLVWLPVNGETKGPFCPLCHSAGQFLIHLERGPEGWTCPNCEALYTGKAGAKPVEREAAVLSFSREMDRMRARKIV